MSQISLNFTNRLTNCLPADKSDHNYPRQVFNACFSRVNPVTTSEPILVAHSKEMGDTLGLDLNLCLGDDFKLIFSGNKTLEGMDPYASCYGGHQFGHWAGQLGDGRAINLGEVLTPSGEYWTLQLKGAGPTPYSRSGDGYAVLRSSIREFLCSEAMFHLGIPTTRALCLIQTGDQVMRDMFYDGRASYEPGAIVCRTAPSFLRFGNFQIHAAREELEILKALADFAIDCDFPQITSLSGGEKYLNWLQEVMEKTIHMVVEWMRVGFVHGVMNTDNMSILGLTIDYGPYGWVDDYNPGWTPNTTDAQGRRYCFGKQPSIAHWNLMQFANSLIPLVEDIPAVQAIIDEFPRILAQKYQQMMVTKLGLKEFIAEHDEPMLENLNTVLQAVETDMTLFYRHLASYPSNTNFKTDKDRINPILNAFYDTEQLNDEKSSLIANWLSSYERRLRIDGVNDEDRRKTMNQVNPLFVMRNYLAQEAIEKAECGDFSSVVELLDVMRTPYSEQKGREKYAFKRPDWARHKPGCSMLSCSS